MLEFIKELRRQVIHANKCGSSVVCTYYDALGEKTRAYLYTIEDLEKLDGKFTIVSFLDSDQVKHQRNVKIYT